MADFTINPDDPIISVPTESSYPEDNRSIPSDPVNSSIGVAENVSLNEGNSAYGGTEIGELLPEEPGFAGGEVSGAIQFDDPLRSNSPALSVNLSPSRRPNLKPLEGENLM